MRGKRTSFKSLEKVAEGHVDALLVRAKRAVVTTRLNLNNLLSSLSLERLEVALGGLGAKG